MFELTLTNHWAQKIIRASGKPGQRPKTKVFQKYLQAYVQAVPGTEFVYRGVMPVEVGVMGRIYDGQMISADDLRHACVYKVLVRCNADRDVFLVHL